MSDQGVTDVHKFTKLADNGKIRIPTDKIVLTLDLHSVPKTVDIACHIC